MKNISCFLVFLLSCFLASCVPHDLETPEISDSQPTTHGKIDSPKPDFKKEVENALATSPPYTFSYGNIPLEWIWANINYKSFDYKKFFSTKCPDNWENGASWLECKYQDETSKRFFSISIHDKLIVVDIEEMSLSNNFLTRRLKGIWEITGNENDFTVIKYEKIIDNNYPPDYSKITTRHITRENRIIASGASSFYLSGSFTFETDGIRFTNCPEKPAGYIYIHGLNTAGVNFYLTKGCNSCVPVAFDGEYGKYAYCGPWLLRDLFDYLKLYIE